MTDNDLTDNARRLPEFSDRDLRLPDSANPRRREVLPDILCSWAAHELKSHFRNVDESIVRQAKIFAAIAAFIGKGRAKLESLDEYGRFGLALSVGSRRKRTLLGGPDADEYFSTIRAALLELEDAASTVPMSRLGKEAWTEFQIIQDIGEIYTWVTADAPRRSVTKGREGGPFRRFAEPIWRAIFGDRDAAQKTLNTAIEKLTKGCRYPPQRQREATNASEYARTTPTQASLISEVVALSTLPRPSHYDLPPRVLRFVAMRHPTWEIASL